MSDWTPGRPVITEADLSQWLAWRREKKRLDQRHRRARLRRFDYCASPDVAAALEILWRPQAGGDYSSIIDGIVRDWLACCHRN